MKKLIKTDLFFFCFLIVLMIYIFYPIIHITFEEWDWMELEYQIKDIPAGQNHLLFWLKYYLTDQYGTTYALIGLSKILFKTSMTAYYIMNVFLRLIAAISLYLLAKWWTNKKSIALISALFFGIAFPGIENTLWVIQFVAYIAVILLCLTIFFWKKFHDNPSSINLKLSVFFFTITLFISHIRLHALPLIILLGEIYYYFNRQKNNVYSKLKLSHLLILILIFLGLYLSSSGLHIDSRVFKTVPLFIIFQSLINGYPPIIHSFFSFIGNVILPSHIIASLNPYTKPLFDFKNLGQVSLIVSSVCVILLILSFSKKRYFSAYLSLLAAIYPISLYFSRDNLPWEESKLASTVISGAVFFLILLMIINLRKVAPKEAGLAILGLIIIVSHLVFPWLAFPQSETNVQAAYSSDHRYYTIPLVGISFIWGVVFFYLQKIIFKSPKKLLKTITSISLILLLAILFVFNGITSRNFLTIRTQHFDKNRDTELWEMIKPIFLKIDDKKRDKIVYIEGNLNEKDKSIIVYFLRHHLINELDYGREDNKYNVTFTLDKTIVRRILEKDPNLYTECRLLPSFSEADFMAFRVNKNGLEDIKEEVIKQIKSQNNL